MLIKTEYSLYNLSASHCIGRQRNYIVAEILPETGDYSKLKRYETEEEAEEAFEELCRRICEAEFCANRIVDMP